MISPGKSQREIRRHWQTTVSERQKHPGGTTEYHSITYNYDNLNRLIYESAQEPNTAEGYDITYEYDLVGNRTYRQINANGQTLQTQYTYNTSDQLTKEVHTEPVAAIPYGYDRVYAYASNNRISYKTAAGGTIGGLMAFFIGLPSEWSYYLFIAAMVLVPVAFFVPVLMSLLPRIMLRCKVQRKSICEPRATSHERRLWHRCLCVMFAYIMLIGPWSFEQLARASTLYSQISTSDWASSNRTIDYQYDDNGSVIEKKTSVTSTEEVLETITYKYNLQNRLVSVSDGTTTVTYKYNPDGIRVQKDDGTTVTNYLIDAYNHTGYAQVLEQWSDGSNPDRTYTIGDDVITDKPGSAPSKKYLLYDGHGSVRQVIWGSGAIAETYSYDGYGTMLGGNPTTIPGSGTNLLYAGQWFDTDSQHYYNRARWYDPLIGRFNRLDPFSGNTQDPQSLHKYLYAHCNPVNGIDPSGNSFILKLTIQTAIRGLIAAALFGTISFTSTKIRGATWGQALWQGVKTAAITGFAFISPLFAWSLALIAPFLLAVGIYAGDVTKEDIPEIAAYIAAGIILILLFKNPHYKAWEVKTAFKIKLPKAIKNLKTGHSINPERNRMWKRAQETGNKGAKGTLIHSELADLMRAENMSQLGVEVSYSEGGTIVKYGTKGSIRVDYVIYHKGQAIKIMDVKPTEIINGSRMNQICRYTNLSPEDIQSLSYGGKL